MIPFSESLLDPEPEPELELVRLMRARRPLGDVLFSLITSNILFINCPEGSDAKGGGGGERLVVPFMPSSFLLPSPFTSSAPALRSRSSASSEDDEEDDDGPFKDPIDLTRLDRTAFT